MIIPLTEIDKCFLKIQKKAICGSPSVAIIVGPGVDSICAALIIMVNLLFFPLFINSDHRKFLNPRTSYSGFSLYLGSLRWIASLTIWNHTLKWFSLHCNFLKNTASKHNFHQRRRNHRLDREVVFCWRTQDHNLRFWQPSAYPPQQRELWKEGIFLDDLPFIFALDHFDRRSILQHRRLSN